MRNQQIEMRKRQFKAGQIWNIGFEGIFYMIVAVNQDIAAIRYDNLGHCDYVVDSKEAFTGIFESVVSQ